MFNNNKKMFKKNIIESYISVILNINREEKTIISIS